MQSNVKQCNVICNGILAELHQPMRNKVKSGRYMKNGGFQEYRNDIKEMREEFEAVHSELAIKVGSIEGLI